MNSSASIGNGLAWLLLLPGNLACDALGLGEADNRDLVRMLVNSLVWMLASIIAAVVVM